MASLRVVLRVPRRDSPAAATTSVSTSSADEDASDDQRLGEQELEPENTKQPNKRKSSYHVRKEAMGELRNQEQALLAQLQAIQATAQETEDDHSSSRVTMVSLLDQNRALHRHVQMNRLAIASVQSTTSSSQFAMPPLGDFIHLPRDLCERRRRLETLKPRKMEDAVRFMLARAQSHDLRRRTRQIETFDTDDGDHIVLDWGVAKYAEDGLTVRRVFDEIVEFAQTHEMALAGKLGVIAVRESEVCPEFVDATEVRILVDHGQRLLIEKHVASFKAFFERSELLDEPHGVLVLDYVDRDDLYPYQPLTRVRKDVTSVTMVRLCPQPSSLEEKTSVPEVAVLRWSYGRYHKTALATEDELHANAREADLFDLMVQTVRERLAWKAS